MAATYLQTGIALATQATQLDAAGNWAEAIPYYNSSIAHSSRLRHSCISSLPVFYIYGSLNLTLFLHSPPSSAALLINRGNSLNRVEGHRTRQNQRVQQACHRDILDGGINRSLPGCVR